MRFLTDDMLGSLTRWLRMLGHDTVYAKDLRLSDSEIVWFALQEDRVLLTRDRLLHGRAKGSVLVRSNDVQGQLDEVARKLKLAKGRSRCPMCNGALAAIDKARYKKRIHAHTYKTKDEFWKCVSCDKVYWRGTHWEKIERRIRTTRSSRA